MYLSDSPDNPLKWRFPEGTVLGPGEYLLVWADEDGQDEPGLHASFRLSSQGETVWLFDTLENGHALLDSVTIDGLAGDQSCGRYPGWRRARAGPDGPDAGGGECRAARRCEGD